eukprot:COSAG02_NODE_4331_length_5494_cov_21.645478_7_plen_28_part_01
MLLMVRHRIAADSHLALRLLKHSIWHLR